MLPSRKASSSCPNFAPRAAFTTASACPTPRPHDSAYAAAGAVTSCPSLRGGGPAAAPPNSHCRVPLIPFFQRRDAPFVLRLTSAWRCAVRRRQVLLRLGEHAHSHKNEARCERLLQG